MEMERRRARRRRQGESVGMPKPPCSTHNSLPPVIRRFHVQRPICAAIAVLYLPLAAAQHTHPTHPIISLARVDSTGLYHVPDGFVVLRQKFNAGYIILSLVIAVVGSLCTLELLIRRTSNRGIQNRLLLLAAGICFGAVSTFSMHFIGNNSLSLHHPEEATNHVRPLYLTYNPGWTVLSLVVSCTVMTLAFFIMGYELRGLRRFLGMQPKQSPPVTHDEAAAKVDTAADDVYSNSKATWKLEKEQAAVLTVNKLRRGMGAMIAKSAQVASWTMLDSGKFTALGNGALGGGGEKEAAKKVHDIEEAEFRGVAVHGPRTVSFVEEPRSAIALGPMRSSGFDSDPSPTEVELSASAPAPAPAPAPPALVFPSGRRGSLPFAIQQGPPPPPSSVFFTPGFSFPPQPSAPPIESTPPWMMIPDAFINPAYIVAETPPVDAKVSAFRRASLPTVSFPQTVVTSKVERDLTFPRSGLTRIQSLSEHEHDLQPSRSRSSEEEQERVKAVLDTVPRTERKVDAGSLRKQRVKSWLAAFLGLNVVTKGEIVKIVFTGFIAGCGIAGMHYIGQRSITGMPYIAYKIRFVVASVIIACAAVIVALYIMFIMLRPKLKHSWYARIGVAFVLGIAVCLMHYTAMGGTIYAWGSSAVPPESSSMVGNKRAIIAVVASLAFAACIGIGIFAVIASRQHFLKKTRRRRVVVASVLFDSHGRVLVSSIDGSLPMCDIASLELEDAALARAQSKSDLDSIGSSLLGIDLTTGHDAFIAALKMTWMWRQVSSGDAPYALSAGTAAESSWNGDLGARTGTNSFVDLQQRRPSAVSGADSMVPSTFFGNDRPLPSNVTRFLDRFSAAAHSLAIAVTGSHTELSRLGVMYDRILTTGYVKIGNFTGSEEDLTVAKGQLIFLVRRVTSSSERSDLLSRNFMFADSAAVAVSVHKALAVPLDHTMALLEDLRQFCDVTTKVTVRTGRLYVGVSVIQPTPFDGLRILVDEADRSQVPMREIASLASAPSRVSHGLPDAELDATVDEIGHALHLLEGISLFEIITRDRAVRPYIDRQDLLATQLMSHCETALVPMLDSILSREDMAYVLPRLVIHPTVVPLGPPAHRGQMPAGGRGPQQPFLIVFRATFDAAVNTYTDKWVPFSLYRAQNKCIMWKGQSLALTPASTLESTARDFDSASYVSTHRRPSKVQFEGYPINDAPAFSPPSIPDPIISDYAFPHKSAKHDLAIRIPPRSSLAQSHLPGGLESPNGSPPWSRSNGLGVASWDPDWLDHMIRDRSGS